VLVVGWRRHGLVEAATIDAGDFGAHLAQVGGQLAAMMNRVMHHELKIENRGIVVDPEEGYRRSPQFGGKLRYFREFGFKAVLIESDDIFGIADVSGHGIVVHFKSSTKKAIEEPDLRRSDVPGEFERAPGIRVGSIGIFDSGHGPQDAAGSGVFLLSGWQEYVREKLCLLGRHVAAPFAQPNGSKPSAIPVPDSIGATGYTNAKSIRCMRHG
jgi:hypothetical protein